MKKINISKTEIETFLDSIESEYSETLLNFDRFKKLFCSDSFNFVKSSTDLPIFKKLYKKISSCDDSFYSQLRNFIINQFLKEYSYCPYCGKSPLIYFDNDNKKKRMFQFDHFFPKNHFHLGVINFFNLIPSCNACNHLKSDKSLDKIEVFHPFFGWVIKNGIDIYFLGDDFDGVSFCENDTTREFIFKTEHAKYFKIHKMYQKSIRDTANVFDFIRDKEIKIKDELKRFPKKFSSKDDAKKYFFENYYSKDKNQVTHFQNGKLKKDLIDNLLP